MVCILFFFFSSRRRHTRFDCDWSSDVCSSDLHHLGRGHDAELARVELARLAQDFAQHLVADAAHGLHMRSEEHTSELQSQSNLVCRLLLEKKKNTPEPARSSGSSTLASCAPTG